MKRNPFIWAVLALALITVSSCSNKDASNSNGHLTGAGSNFPEPFYLIAFDSYHTATKLTVDYDGIGSEKGRDALRRQAVDFAGCDESITDEKLAKLQMKPTIHIPTCLIGVAMCYNIPGVKELKLTGDILVDIYLGKITMWDDERITSVNPDVTLPAKNIIPIYRPDACGRTFVLSSYFSVVSEEWKEKYGSHMLIKFPVGKPVKSNVGLASAVQETPYSIGFVGADFAEILDLPMASIQNPNGEFVKPSPKTIAAAADGPDVPADSRVLLANSPAPGSYPISSYTWLIVYKEQHYNNRTLKQAQNTVELLRFMLSESARQSAEAIDYAPVPKSMVEYCSRLIQYITYDGKPVLR